MPTVKSTAKGKGFVGGQYHGPNETFDVTAKQLAHAAKRHKEGKTPWFEPIGGWDKYKPGVPQAAPPADTTGLV